MLHSFHTQGLIEAGVDEAGRGCLAGPVVAAAVILPTEFHHPLLNDSKQVSEHDRYTLREIIQNNALCWAIGIVEAARIDEINILNASFEAMNKAIEQLKLMPQSLLIDGNRFKTASRTQYHCIIKGDGIYASIAAASILAKTCRDDIMLALHKRHEVYGWNHNKGYPTRFHRRAIEENGLSEHHRRSFRVTSESSQMLLF